MPGRPATPYNSGVVTHLAVFDVQNKVGHLRYNRMAPLLCFSSLLDPERSCMGVLSNDEEAIPLPVARGSSSTTRQETGDGRTIVTQSLSQKGLFGGGKCGWARFQS